MALTNLNLDLGAPEPQPQQSDGRATVAHNIEGMNRIRAKTIENRAMSTKEKDEYLGLAHGLADAMSALPQPIIPETIIQRIDASLRRNPAIAWYDPLQDGHWTAVEPQLVDDLERLAITVLSDRFGGTDEKHHFLQAIRCRQTKDAEPTTRDAVLSEILPYRIPPTPEAVKRRWYQRIADRIAGEEHSIEIEKDLTLRFTSTASAASIGDLVEFGASRGYLDVWLKIPANEYHRYRDQIDEHVKDKTTAPSGCFYLRFSGAGYAPIEPTAPVSDVLEAICRAPIEPGTRASLRIAPDNHHEFGQAFMENVKDIHPEFQDLVGVGVRRPFGQVVYSRHSQLGQYRKDVAAICMQERSYLLTVIAHGKDDPLTKVSPVLAGEGPAAALKTLAGKGLRHARIVQYDGREKGGDIEVNQ